MSHQRRLPAGPKGHFLTGNARDFYQDQLGFLTSCAEHYGDVVRLRFLHVPVYLVSNPTHIESVFISRNFQKPMSLRMPLQRKIFGRGLLSSEGEHWLRNRRIIQQAFSHDRLSHYADVMVDSTRETLALWRPGQVRNVYDDFRELAVKIATRSLFNMKTDADAAALLDVCRTTTGIFYSRSGPLWILDNLFPTPNHLRFRRAITKLDRLIDNLISGASKDDGADDVLSILMANRSDDDTRLSIEQIRDELATLLFASHQAAALALSWTCYLLARHAAAQSNVALEAGALLRRKPNPAAADSSALSCTRKAVLESMRLYPPNRSVGREALSDCEIGGYFVPARAQVLMSQWVVHRDARYFENPLEFKPERWAPEFIRYLPKYAYFPFGGGPRVCIGQDFAMMEAVLVIAAIVERFKLSPADERPVEPQPAILLRPKNGIMIRLAARN